MERDAEAQCEQHGAAPRAPTPPRPKEGTPRSAARTAAASPQRCTALPGLLHTVPKGFGALGAWGPFHSSVCVDTSGSLKPRCENTGIVFYFVKVQKEAAVVRVGHWWGCGRRSAVPRIRTA